MDQDSITYAEHRKLSRIRQELARERAIPAPIVDGDQQFPSQPVGHGAGKSIPHPIRGRNRKNTTFSKSGVGVSIPIPICDTFPSDLIPPATGPKVTRRAQRPPCPVLRAGKMVAWAWVSDPTMGWTIAQDAPADRRFDPVTQYARERTLQARSQAKRTRGVQARDAYRRRRERETQLRTMVGQSA
jgi:hypothetical protein